MDPNATLAAWREATARYDASGGQDVRALREAFVAANDLVAWLDGGGFAPDWGQPLPGETQPSVHRAFPRRGGKRS